VDPAVVADLERRIQEYDGIIQQQQLLLMEAEGNDPPRR